MADGINIDKLKLSVDVDAKNSIKNINKLNSSLTKLSKTINNLGIENLSGLNGIGGGGGSSKGSSGGGGSLRNTLFDMANLSRVLRMINRISSGVKTIIKSTANLVKVGMEYTETLNLWQVAMGQNIDQAEEFVKSMQKAYGLASTTVMQYQATFRNMLNSLGGLSTDTSYKLSEYLMQMALDYSSLYNTTIEKAMADFQSALSGQTRPIRSVSGYDITEDTIYQLYTSLGGKKAESQLTQVEKRLLRIMAIFNQMGRSGAIGDLNKTLENTANQIRIIEEKTTELKSWLGIIVEQLIKPALPIISAFATVLTEVAQKIAEDLGYVDFDGTISGFEEINEQADELSGKLLSFDKFEALNLASDQDSGVGIDQTILDATSEYDSLLENITTKADILADSIRNMFFDTDGNLKGWAKAVEDILKRIMDWFNSLYTINEETGDVDWHLDSIIAKLKSISAIIGLIIATKNKGKITAFLSGITKSKIATEGLEKVGKVLKDVIHIKSGDNSLSEITKNLDAITDSSTTEGLEKVSKSFSSIGKVKRGIGIGGWVAIILAIVGALIYLYNTNEGVKASIDQLFEALKPIVNMLSKLVSQILPLLGKLLQGLAPIISFIIDICTAFIYILDVILIACYAILEAIVKIVQTVMELFDFMHWNTLGEDLSNIWSNWTTADLFADIDANLSNVETGSTITFTPTTDSYSTSSVASTSGITNTSTATTTSAETAMTNSTYSALRTADLQSGGSKSTAVGNVYIDGVKAGQVMAKSTHNENVRAGRLKSVSV